MSELTVEQHREAVREEYSQWVATQVIEINGVRAFNPGDAVPASHVERGVVSKDQVAPAGSDEAKDQLPLERPTNNASLSAWQAYAQQEGVDTTDLTRDDIAARFPKES